MRNLWDNIIILSSSIKNNPKKSIAVLLVLVLIGWFAQSRLPAAVSCYWQAEFVQSVPEDLWRFNMWDKQCQYYNGKRWIPLDRVLDVGSGDEIEIQ